MKKMIFAMLGASVLSGAAFASGSHEGGHGHDSGHDNSDGHHGPMAVGMPGNASKIDRTIDIIMKETDEGDMLFEPASITVKEGETIRFAVKNIGELEHEFILDDSRGITEHRKMMEENHEMHHDDPNEIEVEAGAEGELIWTFSNAGEFEFACLIPGHYESGMKGSLTVSH